MASFDGDSYRDRENSDPLGGDGGRFSGLGQGTMNVIGLFHRGASAYHQLS